VTGPDTRQRELEDGLRRSRGGFMSRLRGLLVGDSIDPATWEEVEESLIAGDVGADLATEVVERARERGARDGVEAAVRRELREIFAERRAGWRLSVQETRPAVVLIVGVNGTGKTTTIGKLATREAAAGRKVVLAAADTFRAAAFTTSPTSWTSSPRSAG
jgi:fused signal recognition particle receptor